ncbi:hypothetical protein [Tabrizicola sp.]|uniref:hypothetical protein n=1 Tax=Tabrizicola sp. TaxID=2005166 RepID=UPI0025F3D9B9|nr:hypothetical protein [Tabrizicola sp.]MBY0351543.1 hypothetical protein [Tabrizicola sp.]
MTRRRTLSRDLTLCGGLALWLVAGQGAVAEVIDLGAGAEDLRVRASVLDFGKELPKRVDPNSVEFAESAETEAADDGLVVLATYGTTPEGRGPRGTAQIEDLVLDVGDDYPMLTSGMAAFTIYIAADLTPASLASVETIGDVLSFVVVMMLGTGLIAMVPTIAQSLASTATGLGSVAASTFRTADSVKGYGRTGIASGIGAGRGAAGLDAGGRRPSDARLNGNTAGQIGRSAVQTALRLASRTPGKS